MSHFLGLAQIAGITPERWQGSLTLEALLAEKALFGWERDPSIRLPVLKQGCLLRKLFLDG
jgi:hypothetical protein